MTSMASPPPAIALDRLASFREAFDGEIVLPSDPGFDDARRVWNGMIDRRPAVVVRPNSSDAVARAIRFARDNDLEISVRGGGHSMSGHSTSDGGLVIDLSRLRGVTVDPDARRALVKGGTLLGELDLAAQAYGLVCPVGVVSHTGVGGLTLGGGMGRLQRKFGFTIDNLRRIELVTADGRLIGASESENPELFWAIRGAGANFGVVTLFEFALHPYDGVQTRGIFVYPGREAPSVFAAFRDYANGAPGEVHAAITFSRALPEADYPAAVAGEPIVSVGLTYAGETARAARVLAPAARFGSVAYQSLTQHGYLEVQRMADETAAWGGRVYTKGGFTNDFPAAAVEALVDRSADGVAGDSFGMWAQGGAIVRTPDEATAFAGRSARFEMSAESTWHESADDEAHIAWGRGTFAVVEPHAVVGRYVNDVTESGGDLARAIYGDAKYERLRGVKREWDPDNVFHLNQNIAP